MNRISLRALSSISLLLFAGSSHAASENDSKPDLVIGSFPFPPLLHTAEGGEFSGTMGETVKYLCAEAGLRCAFRVAPLARVYKEVRNGKVDALITLDLGQFNDCCQLSLWHSPWSAGLFSSLPEGETPSAPDTLLGHSLIVVNGMRSPYSFFPNLNQWSADKKVNLSVARDIPTSIKMFTRGRAPLLWGGEDFRWYIDKIEKDARYSYHPLLTKNVAVWVRKDKRDLTAKLDRAFVTLLRRDELNEQNLLKDPLMKQRYIDAPSDFKADN